MSHNGYTNFQTFTVANAIYNYKPLYDCFKNVVKEVKEKNPEGCRVSALSDILKNTVLSKKPYTNDMIWGPLMANAMETVNYSEIARLMLAEEM